MRCASDAPRPVVRVVASSSRVHRCTSSRSPGRGTAAPTAPWAPSCRRSPPRTPRPWPPRASGSPRPGSRAASASGAGSRSAPRSRRSWPGTWCRCRGTSAARCRWRPPPPRTPGRSSSSRTCRRWRRGRPSRAPAGCRRSTSLPTRTSDRSSSCTGPTLPRAAPRRRPPLRTSPRPGVLTRCTRRCAAPAPRRSPRRPPSDRPRSYRPSTCSPTGVPRAERPRLDVGSLSVARRVEQRLRRPSQLRARAGDRGPPLELRRQGGRRALCVRTRPRRTGRRTASCVLGEFASNHVSQPLERGR